ncbi:MAG: hypothetical protein F6J93_22370 [Oscillatoria sp. SIO1A7]|nr:hypothetical protein [Oscillatoria sp. SIO1A7]
MTFEFRSAGLVTLKNRNFLTVGLSGFRSRARGKISPHSTPTGDSTGDSTGVRLLELHTIFLLPSKGAESLTFRGPTATTRLRANGDSKLPIIESRKIAGNPNILPPKSQHPTPHPTPHTPHPRLNYRDLLR